MTRTLSADPVALVKVVEAEAAFAALPSNGHRAPAREQLAEPLLLDHDL